MNSMRIAVEVAYGTPAAQVVIAIECESPVTIEQAIQQSGIATQFPQRQLEDDMVGVFGFRKPLNHLLEDGDRVEIYRPLTMSPTEARKMRAVSREKCQNRA